MMPVFGTTCLEITQRPSFLRRATSSLRPKRHRIGLTTSLTSESLPRTVRLSSVACRCAVADSQVPSMIRNEPTGVLTAPTKTSSSGSSSAVTGWVASNSFTQRRRSVARMGRSPTQWRQASFTRSSSLGVAVARSGSVKSPAIAGIADTGSRLDSSCVNAARRGSSVFVSNLADPRSTRRSRIVIEISGEAPGDHGSNVLVYFPSTLLHRCAASLTRLWSTERATYC
jgi:hypothetical protein